jgi:hypothetical protein
MARQRGKAETAAAQNIDAILRLEKKEEQALALHHRIFHMIGGFVGTVHFLFLQCLAVSLWIGFNVYFSGRAVDEYPFPLLATILAAAWYDVIRFVEARERGVYRVRRVLDGATASSQTGGRGLLGSQPAAHAGRASGSAPGGAV